MTLADADARRRIETELDRTFVVEAAAGTGKTTALVARMVATLRTGRARLAEIVAVTFTGKAAGELKLRLRAALEVARRNADDEERPRLETALAELEVARIGTIHSFCAELLRERPVEAGVDPDFEVLAEEQERTLLGRAFDRYFEEVLHAPPEGVRRALRRGRNPRDSLRAAVRDLAGRRDHPAPWSRPAWDRVAAVDALVEGLRDLAALSKLATDPKDALARDLTEVAAFLESVEAREKVDGRDHDRLEAEAAMLRRVLTRKRSAWKRWYGSGLPRADVLGHRDRVAEAVTAFARASQADLAACLQRDLAAAVERYQRLKDARGNLDFLDLLIRTRDLLRDRPEVLRDLRGRVAAVFVDEFQDTDPLQAEVLLLLASDVPAPLEDPLGENLPPPRPGALFLVGDPKQSIYRFRRADVALYERIKRRLEAGGAETLELSTNFRATPDLAQLTNVAFAPEMRGAEDGSQARYVPLSPFREAPAAQPSVVALPVPRPYGRYGKVWRGAVEASCPDSIGAFLDWLLTESGWTVDDGEGRRPVESRDVCLLFRQMAAFRADRTQPYVRALEAREIPHVLVGGRALRDREEVLGLLHACRAIEHPGDRLHVYATLRGPFFALTDEALLLHRTAEGSLHPLAPLGDALWDPERRAVPEALSILGELHRHRNRRPFADTLTRFLDETRAHAGVANWPNGEQALANALRVVELARLHESQGGLSFRSFVAFLEQQLEEGRGVAAPVVEEGAEGVRIMTVHRAKGLEFPVVVLCDPLLAANERPSRFVDAARGLWAAPLAGCVPRELSDAAEAVLAADRAEEVRLSYVAATRARDLLVVPTFGDGAPGGGWLAPLDRALYPAAKRAAKPGVGLPAFGLDSVLDRPVECRAAPEDSVQPGLHRVDGVDVAWWDPAVLALGRVPAGGLRRLGLLSADAGGGDEQLEAHLAWVEAREALRAKGAEPSERVQTVTEVARAAEESERPSPPPEPERSRPAAEVAIDRTEASRAGRPRGARFGTLVHAVLAEAPLDAAGPEAIAALARHHALLLGAPETEADAAVDAARAALSHPHLLAAREAAERDPSHCRRESPVLLERADGALVEGVIDLAYRASDGWVIVDFKTDATAEPSPAYRAQVRLYVEAVARATGEAATGALLYV